MYSKFLIEFMYSFQQVVHQLKTFVFSTQLVALSQVLRDGNYEKVLENLSEQVPNWAGGTRIGSSLDTFKTNYGNHILNKDSIVIIISDGWDTGVPEVLSDAMKAIYKKAKKVVWLNPLAGNPNFVPEALGMQAALPYIDVLGAAHNMESLKKALSQLQRKRKLLRRS